MRCRQGPGAVVIGGYINGLGVVRALGARGVPSAVIRTQPFDLASRSRYAVASEAVLDLDDRPERLIQLLERRAVDWRGWALFPTNDGALAALALHHEQLSGHYRVLAPPWEVARPLLDKSLMWEAASGVGIRVPHRYGPADALTAEVPELRFPVLVKPVTGHLFSARFGCKLFLAVDRDQLRQAVARAGQARLSCEIFDCIPGPDSQLYVYGLYIDRRGEPSAGLTMRKVRQSPPFFGVARVAQIAPHNATLREASIELARRLGYRGIVGVEFKLDPRDGSFRLMEIGGRSFLANGLFRRAGLDLAGLAWADCVEGRPEAARANGWPGAWINLHADLLYSTLARRQDPLRLAAFLAPYRRPWIEAVWSAADPMPFVAQWGRTASRGLAALARGKGLPESSKGAPSKRS